MQTLITRVLPLHVLSTFARHPAVLKLSV